MVIVSCLNMKKDTYISGMSAQLALILSKTYTGSVVHIRKLEQVTIS